MGPSGFDMVMKIAMDVGSNPTGSIYRKNSLKTKHPWPSG
jgi:hypothetical protein